MPSKYSFIELVELLVHVNASDRCGKFGPFLDISVLDITLPF